jgi:hypothetical protein
VDQTTLLVFSQSECSLCSLAVVKTNGRKVQSEPKWAEIWRKGHGLASEKQRKWQTHYPAPGNIRVSKGARDTIESCLGRGYMLHVSNVWT